MGLVYLRHDKMTNFRLRYRLRIISVSKMVTPSQPYRHSITLLYLVRFLPIPTPAQYLTHVLRPACILNLLSTD